MDNTTSHGAPASPRRPPLDFDTVNAAVLPHLEDLCRRLLPGGRRIGAEWTCGSLRGGPGASCKINLKSGKWADFAAGQTGGDPVSLAAAVAGVGQAEAARDLAQRLGLEGSPAMDATPSPIAPPPPPDGLLLQVPAPMEPPAADKIHHPKHGTAVAQWVYRDAQGRPLCTAVRFDAFNEDGSPKLNADGKQEKEILPRSFVTRDGKRGWQFKALPAPRPLYGLDRLTARPDAPVLVTEGEKAADAATGLFPEHVAVTWQGGSGAADKGDWSALVGRRVTVWPDADTPGGKAAAAVAKAAREAGAASAAVVKIPAGWPEGWDLADHGDAARPQPADITLDMLRSMLVQAQGLPGEGDLSEAPDLRVLHQHRRPPPVLPLDVFGAWGPWMLAAAEAAAAPVDYVAAPLLAAASVITGNARWAQAHAGWREPPHLWCASVGDSGGSKSPGADIVIRDLVPGIEARMVGDFSDRLREWQAAAEIAKARQETWAEEVRVAMKKGNAPPLPPVLDLLTEEPRAPQLKMHDATHEQVALCLANGSPKGLLLVRDELAGHLLGMNRYSEAARAFWLESYGGRPYRVDRVKHPVPVNVSHLVVGWWGGTQPARLAEIMRGADDGLLARYIWFWPSPVPFDLPERTPDVPWASEAFDRLRQLEMQPDDAGRLVPIMVPLAQDAVMDLRDFAREMQARQQDTGGLLNSAIGKARGLALRLSLVIEFLWWAAEEGTRAPPLEITRRAFLAATTLVAEYLLPMAERVYGDAATSPADRAAATLARWIAKTRPAEVHVRTLQRDVRLPGLGDAEAIHAAAGALVDAGWLLPMSGGGGGAGRPRATYPINPALWAVLP